MFESSLIEQKRTKPTTALISVALHIGIIAALILTPLISTAALPPQQLLAFFVNTPRPPQARPAPPPPEKTTPQPTVQTEIKVDPRDIIAPREIPKDIAYVDDGPPQAVPNVPREGKIGVITGVLYIAEKENAAAPPPPPPPPPAPPTQRIRVGGNVAQASLVFQVKPVYPPLAKQARIQGVVILEAVIGKDGSISEIRVVSGHPLLTQAAIDAVKQWRYKPTLLNGEPVEVVTTITVNFAFSQ